MDDTVAHNYIRQVRRKEILGVPISEDEREMFRSFLNVFRHLAPPLHVFCDQRQHAMHGGAVMFADEIVDGVEISNVRFFDGHWLCILCESGKHVLCEASRLADVAPSVA